MKNIKNIKIKAVVFIVAALFLATTVTVNADEVPKLDPAGSIKSIELPDYSVLWKNTYPGQPGKVAVDSIDNVLVCGKNIDDNPVLIKYHSDGLPLWDVVPTSVDLAEPVDLATLDPDYQSSTKASHEVTPEQRQIILNGVYETALEDVVCDSEDNIVSCGTSINPEDGSSILVVVKHDPDSVQLWNRTFSFSPDESGFVTVGGIAVDSNDNVYIAGTAIIDDDSSFSVSGVAMKLGKFYGVPHWVKIHSDTLFLRVYTGVDVNVDSTDHPFFTGYLLSIPSFEYTTAALELEKYFGWILNENYIENDLFAVAMVIDQVYNRIYIVGSDSSDGFIVKLDFSLNVIYQSMTPNDHFQDVAILNDDELILATQTSDTGYNLGVHSKEDGIRIRKYAIRGNSGQLPAFVGVAVDSNEDVLTTSSGLGTIDTMKFQIFEDIVKCTPLGDPEADLSE